MPRDPSENQAPAGEAVLLEWTVHLLRREPAKARAVIVCMALTAILGAWTFRSPLFALLGPLLLLSATAEYLLPIHCRLTDRRACVSYGAARLVIEWEKVKRVETRPDAVRLSPFAFPNRLDNFRGVVVRFAPPGEPGDHATVMRIIEERSAARKPIDQQTGAVPANGTAS